MTSGRMLPVACAIPILLSACAQQPKTVTAPTTRPAARTDAHGNPLRVAKTGHVSNYDETKVGHYTLPNPLILANGKPVRDAAAWFARRRPEILKLYENDIYGRVPDNAPHVTFSSASSGPVNGEEVMGGKAMATHLEGHIGGPNGPTIHLLLLVPAHAQGPVPVILNLSFFAPPAMGESAAATPAPPTTRPRRAFVDTTPIADILAHGYAYATFRYTDIQPDNAATFSSGVIALTLKPGQTHPAPNQWGTISAWAWGVSRVVDYLATNPALDAQRIAIVGHSRLGKTVLWAGAQDPRIALVFSSCAGEMGSALARRDFGETIDDMAQNFPYQFAANFQHYVGHWNNMPVDAHMLISLVAPRPLLITGGSLDQWSDPHGEFLAAVAATPVYQLLGKKGLSTDQMPPLDTPLASGNLAFEEHTGPHAITAGDWKIFLNFADEHLHPRAAGDNAPPPSP